MFYAFQYTDGKRTTTGTGRLVRISGELIAFNKKQERDSYISGDHPAYGTHSRRRDWDSSKMRYTVSTVTTRQLPYGWHTRDAVMLVNYDGWWMTEPVNMEPIWE